MCEAAGSRGYGWKVWVDLPSTPECNGLRGSWTDLSYRLSAKVPRAAVFPQPRFARVRSLPVDPLNVTEMQMVVHIGTHVDAPRHFFLDGPAFHDIPIERLSGPGVVLPFDKTADGVITESDLDEVGGSIHPGDIVALHTGWAKHAGTHQYHEHPHLSVSAAQWLLDRGVKLAAFDVPTPDLPVVRRPPGYDWPVHHVLLSHGVLISENVTGLTPLVGKRVEFAFLALNIEDSDGAPARVIARAIAPDMVSMEQRA
jgi:kynurenine formamidase